MSKLACNSVYLLVILVLWIVANANIRQQDELQVFREVQERLKAYHINCIISNIKFESILDTFVFKTSS